MLSGWCHVALRIERLRMLDARAFIGPIFINCIQSRIILLLLLSTHQSINQSVYTISNYLNEKSKLFVVTINSHYNKISVTILLIILHNIAYT